jgi:tetratricopeptide (TPR) repeat protein
LFKRCKLFDNAKVVTLFFGFVFVLRGVLVLRGLYEYVMTETVVEATVDDFKLSDASTDGQSGLKQIVTNKGVFIDVPNQLRGKYKSQYYGKLIPGATYKFTLDKRNVFGITPNIMDAELVDKGTVPDRVTTEGLGSGEVPTIRTPMGRPEQKATKKPDKDAAKNFYESANRYYQDGEYEKAIEFYEKAQELWPDNKNIQLNLDAAIQMQLKNAQQNEDKVLDVNSQ